MTETLRLDSLGVLRYNSTILDCIIFNVERARSGCPFYFIYYPSAPLRGYP